MRLVGAHPSISVANLLARAPDVNTLHALPFGSSTDPTVKATPIQHARTIVLFLCSHERLTTGKRKRTHFRT